MRRLRFSFDFDECLVSRQGAVPPGSFIPVVAERPVQLVLGIMLNLHHRGQDVMVTTARTKPFYSGRKSPPTIRTWLREWGMPDVPVHYTGGAAKGLLLQRLDVDVHFDDQDDQLRSAWTHNIRTVKVDTLWCLQSDLNTEALAKRLIQSVEDLEGTAIGPLPGLVPPGEMEYDE